ncbi:MAG: hypothetical protein JXA17_01865 [Dehalococcoidales bacterium]|nr:hypothetical protein [Dehalococcoidales bacterium]
MVTKNWIPSQKQVDALLAFRNNSSHYIQKSNELKERHAGMFIAILDGNVLFSKENAEELFDEIRSNFDKSNASKIFVTYIPKEDEVMVA